MPITDACRRVRGSRPAAPSTTTTTAVDPAVLQIGGTGRRLAVERRGLTHLDGMTSDAWPALRVRARPGTRRLPESRFRVRERPRRRHGRAGCSLNCSAAEAIRSISSESECLLLRAMTLLSRGVPVVRVPVLSMATRVVSARCSMATADLTRTPWRPALAIADSSGGMVASTTAHGDATIMNVIARSNVGCEIRSQRQRDCEQRERRHHDTHRIPLFDLLDEQLRLGFGARRPRRPARRCGPPPCLRGPA